MSKSDIKQFREDNIGELDKCLKVAVKIRDGKTSTARDKNEAIKIIARLLSALQPDRTVTETRKSTGRTEELSPELLERIKDEYSPKITPKSDTSPKDVVAESSM